MRNLTKAQQRMVDVIASLNGKPLGDIALSTSNKRVLKNLLSKKVLVTGSVSLNPFSVINVNLSK